jgi:hypothetical protein
VDPDPDLDADPDPAESGHPLLGMNLNQNFSDKIHNFLTKCTIKINKNLSPHKNFPKKIKLPRNFLKAETSVAGSGI